jgi:hypothetical protein
MKRLLFLFLVFALASSAQSQIDYRIETYLDSHKIDTFLIYEFECSGEILPGDVLSDSCQFDEPHYLFWKQNGSFFLKRFDYCKTFKPIVLDTINPLRYYLQNKKLIHKEEIKRPTYFETKKIKNKIEKVQVNLVVDHSCCHRFRLSRDSEYKYAYTYYLDFKEFDNGKRNVYYTHNQITRFKKLIDLTSTLLKVLEKENQFQPE